MSKRTFKHFFESCGLRHSDEESTPEVKYIGTFNSWHDDPPAEYIAHTENCCETVDAGVNPNIPNGRYTRLKCPTVTKKIGRNREEITCKKCGIQWVVES